MCNLLLPLEPEPAQNAEALAAATDALCQAIRAAPGPLLLVSNEIGLGVIPMGPEVRHFVDELGRLNQALAATCDRVTLMVAGIPLKVKGS